MNIYGVIMAGGSGERFWPESRIKHPKQFMNIVGQKSMIQQTVKRITPIIPLKNVLIVSNKNHKKLIFKQLPKISKEKVFLEPFGKNTAPCIAFAAAYLQKISPNSIMVVLPSDHVIKKEKEFNRVILDAVKMAQSSNQLIAIGIKPENPETGYGYIKIGKKKNLTKNTNFYEAQKFVEKPSLIKAKKYVKSGQYVWNSGMFVWKTKTILDSIKEHNKALYHETEILSKKLLTQGQDEAIKKMYRKVEKISIDYAVMEKAKNILVATGSFGWDDVGVWSSLERHYEKDKERNIKIGESVGKESHNNLLISRKGLIATIGISNLIVIQTDDAVLIANKNKAQDVKWVVENLKKDNNLKKYL